MSKRMDQASPSRGTPKCKNSPRFGIVFNRSSRREANSVVSGNASTSSLPANEIKETKGILRLFGVVSLLHSRHLW